MTDYDTSTLNGSLLQLGDTMAENLQEKGVTDASVDDGLTTLAGKILDISGEEVFKLEASETLVDVGDSVTLTATVSPYTSGKTIKLYSGITFVANMIDRHNGKYEYTINTLTSGVFPFKARDGDKYTQEINVRVRANSNLEITSVNGLRPHPTSFMEYVYDGDEFTVKGSLTDSNDNPIPNQPLNLSLGDVDVGTTITDSNGLFTATVITPYFPLEESQSYENYNLKIKYDGTEVYGEAEDNTTITYRLLTIYPPKSLRYLQKLVDEAKDNAIHLTHDFEYMEGDVGTGVLISNPLTINGHDYSIDCKESCRLFNITGNTVLNDLNVSNCQQANTGGAIYFNNTNGSLELYNCSFDKCKAKNTAGTTKYNGGCVYSNSLKLVIDNCLFTYCEGNDGGAGWHENNGASGSISVTNSIFDHNVGGSDGGALCVRMKSITVDNCKFRYNVNSTSDSTSGGGACLLNCKDTDKGLLVTNSDFINNICTNTYSEADTGGGALWLSAAPNCMVVNCNFIGNYARSRGGAIMMRSSGTIKSSVFRGNQSYDTGGTIQTQAGSATINSCIFLNNSAGGVGGVLRTNGANSTVRDCIVLGNTGSTVESIFSWAAGYKVYLYYNWFGSNSSNKNTKPIYTNDGIVLYQWLYVTSSIDDDSINVGEISRIKYDFNHYATTSTSGDYDASNILQPEFDASSGKGLLNMNKVVFVKGLSNLLEFTAAETGTGTVTLELDGTTYSTTNISIGKGASNLTVEKPLNDETLKKPVKIEGVLEDTNGNPLKNKTINITED